MGPYQKVLFPTDYSKNSEHAFAHAVRLTEFQKGELIIQHVVNDYFERTPHWVTLFDLRQLQLHLDAFAEQEMTNTLASVGENIRVRSVISRGKTADEIVALAEKEKVDLIVMGSAAGSITNAVIRATNRPVLAISSHLNASTLSGSAGHILVATDFSEHSKKVVRYAFELKKAFNATIYLIYVIETTKAIEFALKQGHYTDATARMTEWAMNQLLNLVPDEFLDDPKVVRLVETGNASERIAAAAREIGVDLTVLGTHEYGTMHRHLVGTTTDRFLSKMESPLLAVKVQGR
jgi:nucleotide-binding universal stress UspA family protein